jgi:hypothetical protein
MKTVPDQMSNQKGEGFAMPEPTNEEFEESLAFLRSIPEYHDLVNYGEDPKTNKLLTIRGASGLIGISPRIVEDYAESGKFRGALRYPDLGWRIPYTSLIYFMAELRRRSQAG